MMQSFCSHKLINLRRLKTNLIFWLNISKKTCEKTLTSFVRLKKKDYYLYLISISNSKNNSEMNYSKDYTHGSNLIIAQNILASLNALGQNSLKVFIHLMRLNVLSLPLLILLRDTQNIIKKLFKKTLALCLSVEEFYKSLYKKHLKIL